MEGLIDNADIKWIKIIKWKLMKMIRGWVDGHMIGWHVTKEDVQDAHATSEGVEYRTS